MLPQDTTHLIQRTRCQRGSLCQNPAGNRTTRRRPDHRKETQSTVVWTCLPFIRCGQNHLARYGERGKKTRQTEEEVGRQIREWTGLEFAKSQRAVENREKLEETGCEVICGAPTTLAVEGLMMMTIIINFVFYFVRAMCSGLE